MGGLVYSGKFENKINELYSPKNIHETAKKFADHEKNNGPYKFGDGYTKNLVPKADDWADDSGSTAGHGKWEKHSGDIPQHIKDKLTNVISSNLKSAHPLPMVLKVGENVDNTHDLHVRTFSHGGHVHIGMHILCPNTSLK
jgi:hypothetical protein